MEKVTLKMAKLDTFYMLIQHRPP